MSVIITLYPFQSSFAQNDDVALGIRLTPDGVGATGKLFLKKDIAFEGQVNFGGIIGGGSESYTITGLLQYYIPLTDTHWRIYFGGGFHGGLWNRNNAFFTKEGRTKTNNQNGIFGVDAIGGVEYLIPKTSCSLGADFKPSINFLNEVDLFPNNMFGVSFSYYFK